MLEALLGLLQLLLRPGIELGPHWREADALTTTLWRLTSDMRDEQAPSQALQTLNVKALKSDKRY